jgi:hypothetical protein
LVSIDQRAKKEIEMKMTAFATAALFGSALSGLSLAADAAKLPPIVLKNLISIPATVVAIDHANRTVSLKGPQGNVVDLIVDEAVTRFDAMKVGDKVTGSYFESVAFEIQKPGTPIAADSIVHSGGKLSGDKPGGATTEQTVATVTILAIDPAKPAVEVRTSDGAVKSYRVRHPEYLDKFKVGDQVQVTKTAALLVSVQPVN